MTTIDERTAQREASLRSAVDSSRRLARPEDYVFDKAQEAFWDLRDGTVHSEKGVDASIPMELWRMQVVTGRNGREREQLTPPSRDIMRVENDQFVEGSTWWPGEAVIIRDLFIDSNGHRPAPGRRIYNKYVPPPQLPPGSDPIAAAPWLAHVRHLWPDPLEHNFFFDVCAHMVQRPEEKCNAAVVLSGVQGIGKDAALVPVKAAVGNWNAKGIDPDELFSPYKPWLETLMLVVDEMRPSKDEFHASSAYNILKPMIVAPPDTLPLNDKYAKLRHIVNRLRVFITTNDWMSMYIPPEDRRMFIMHSVLPTRWHVADQPDYFTQLFDWFHNHNGLGHCAAWLATRDLRHFDPKAQVARTAGWAAVTASWGAPEDAVAWALERLEHPDVVLGMELLSPQFDHRDEVLATMKSPRKIGHRMNAAGYTLVPPPDDAARWVFRFGGKVVRTRYSFVKQHLAQDMNGARTLVMQRARRLIEAGALAES